MRRITKPLKFYPTGQPVKFRADDYFDAILLCAGLLAIVALLVIDLLL